MRFKSLRTWGSNSRGYMSFDDPVGEDPHPSPQPMIIEVELLIPLQKANTLDPRIETPSFMA
jgi:hypothetical protein